MKKKEKLKYYKNVCFQLKGDDWELLKARVELSTCRSISEYIRKLVLAKPVTVKYRNQSVDELLSETIQLKNELTAIGNIFSQAVKLLKDITGTDEARDWTLFNEAATHTLFHKIEEIRQRMIQNYQQWSQT